MPKEDNGVTYYLDVCRKCKSTCCQEAKPPLTENRKKLIMSYLKKHKIYIEKPFSKKDYSYPSVDDNNFCKFNNKVSSKCQVHPVKPETCTAGPITFNINFSIRKVEWFLKKSEICAYAGRLKEDEAKFKGHLKVAKKKISRLIKELDANELRVLMNIEEPQTFKVGEDDLPSEVVRKLGL